ncbi:uncharacterized protein LOC116618859 [Nematostella vectensis]|uniref:uncharacterized protein LOC116618859 n=1 Tax=Nematostella vectensis TaxID=45351 RepID=UPI0020772D0F|nr:uncharacterized protein LOC116618859 [Nematostella vectensis]
MGIPPSENVWDAPGYRWLSSPTVEHSAMLLRGFRSFAKYSGQGFEASHKLHRQLYSKASNHDSSGPGQSMDQILTHWYASRMLHLRYSFRQAVECIEQGKNRFRFRGCGWKKDEHQQCSDEEKVWVITIEKLFTDLFGHDKLAYHYDKDHGTSVDETCAPDVVAYDHDE